MGGVNSRTIQSSSNSFYKQFIKQFWSAIKLSCLQRMSV
jgi:hypothetical protein